MLLTGTLIAESSASRGSVLRFVHGLGLRAPMLSANNSFPLGRGQNHSLHGLERISTDTDKHVHHE